MTTAPRPIGPRPDSLAHTRMLLRRWFGDPQPLNHERVMEILGAAPGSRPALRPGQTAVLVPFGRKYWRGGR